MMRWAVECLAALGVPDDSALLLAQSFVKMSLFGFDLQGVDRLLQDLEVLSREGWTEPAIGLQFTGHSTALVDGGSGHGIITGHRANELAIMHAIARGLGAARVVSPSDCGAMALYTRRAAESKLLGIAFSKTQQPSIDDNGDSCSGPAKATVSIALPNATGHLVCADIAGPEAFLEGETGRGHGPTDVELGWRDEVRQIVALALGPLIDHSLLLNVLELTEPIDQAGPLFLVVDPTRLIEGAAIAVNLRRKVELVQRRNSSAETLGDPVSIEEVIRRAVGIPISLVTERQISFWSDALSVAFPFADSDGCPATIQ